MKQSKKLLRAIGSVKFFALFVLAAAVDGQQPIVSPASPKESAAFKTYQLSSKLLGRQIPYAVYLPVDYDADRSKRFRVMYLLHGLSGSYRTFAENPDRLADFPKRHAIFVFVEGGLSFFTDSETVSNDKYESYVTRELIPEIDKNFRTIADRRGRAVAGVSMGGYGAIKFGVKYPQLFYLAASWSGVVNAASWRKLSELPPRPRTVQAVTAVFGDGSDPAPLIANDLFRILEDVPADKVTALPFFYLDCGTEDELLQPNQQLAEIFVRRKIPHEYRQIPGGHGLQDYRVMDVLDLSERLLTIQKASSAPTTLAAPSPTGASSPTATPSSPAAKSK